MIFETTFEGDTNKLRIIGILEDFHHSSLYEPVGPYMIRYKKEEHDWAGFITIRLGVAGKGIPITIEKIRKTWLSMTGEAPFQYFFLDEELDNYYKEETADRQVINSFFHHGNLYSLPWAVRIDHSQYPPQNPGDRDPKSHGCQRW